MWGNVNIANMHQIPLYCYLLIMISNNIIFLANFHRQLNQKTCCSFLYLGTISVYIWCEIQTTISILILLFLYRIPFHNLKPYLSIISSIYEDIYIDRYLPSIYTYLLFSRLKLHNILQSLEIETT